MNEGQECSVIFFWTNRYDVYIYVFIDIRCISLFYMNAYINMCTCCFVSVYVCGTHCCVVRFPGCPCQGPEEKEPREGLRRQKSFRKGGWMA